VSTVAALRAAALLAALDDEVALLTQTPGRKGERMGPTVTLGKQIWP
jgi:hypothetical protein